MRGTRRVSKRCSRQAAFNNNSKKQTLAATAKRQARFKNTKLSTHRGLSNDGRDRTQWSPMESGHHAELLLP
eukprot:scaffold83051_cov17-Tisochrysis_lutea.AAC.1